MRTLERLSASSFIITTPAPARAKPSRRIAHPLEIAGVDFLEAGVAGLDAHQLAARFDDRSRHRGARVAARLDAEPVRRLGSPA